jgi:hypothetical protein
LTTEKNADLVLVCTISKMERGQILKWTMKIISEIPESYGFFRL